MNKHFNFLVPFQAQAYALLRITSGFMFLFHGVQKILGIFGDAVVFSQAPQLWIGGLIELVFGLFLMVGFQTRLAAFISSGTMAVAFFQFHAIGAGSILPIVNKGELAALYCFVFLYIATRGSGIWSIDRES